MKKNSYYFSLLSEVEQGQYKSNYELFSTRRMSFDKFLDKENKSFETFVMNGFSWVKTRSKNQGVDYWLNISNRPEPKEPTDQDQNIVLVQFIPTLAEIESILKSDKFKKYSFKDLAYSLSAENILDIILELQKPKP